jgi:hypothetical protein
MTAAIVSTDRVRAFRGRRRAGVIQMTICVNEVALVEKLVEAGLLPAAQIDDRVAITKATEQLLEIFVPEKGAVGGIDKKVDSGL